MGKWYIITKPLQVRKMKEQNADILKLRYGMTNTFFIRGNAGGLLVDTDYAGTLPAFYHAIKAAGIGLKEIRFILATHYHPDHIGLVSELMKQGVKLLLIDLQKDSVHYSDRIFERDRHLRYDPIDETAAAVISCGESRDFLYKFGVKGEIISTPSHSPDSVSLILDSGDCLVGDLEPLEYLAAYEDNPALRADWERILAFDPKRILYAHANEKMIYGG